MNRRDAAAIFIVLVLVLFLVVVFRPWEDPDREWSESFKTEAGNKALLEMGRGPRAPDRDRNRNRSEIPAAEDEGRGGGRER